MTEDILSNFMTNKDILLSNLAPVLSTYLIECLDLTFEE